MIISFRIDNEKANLIQLEREIANQIAVNIGKKDVWINVEARKVISFIAKCDISAKTFELLCHFQELRRIHLDKGLVEQIPSEIGNLSGLKSFYISDYRGDSLPPEIGSLRNLTSLYLSSNDKNFDKKGFFVPNSISDLKFLQTISLRRLNLQKFPVGLYQCVELEKLILTSANIEEISPSIEQLNNLQKIDLSYNQITKLPKNLQKMPSLKEVIVRHNNIKCLPKWIGELPSSIHFDVSFNEISSLPKFIIQKMIEHKYYRPTNGNLRTFFTFNLSNPWDDPLKSVFRWFSKQDHDRSFFHSKKRKHWLTLLDLDMQIMEKCKQKTNNIRFTLEEFSLAPIFPRRLELLKILDNECFKSNHHIQQMCRDIIAQIKWEKIVAKNIKKVQSHSKMPEEIQPTENLQQQSYISDRERQQSYHKIIKIKDFDTLKIYLAWEKDINLLDNIFTTSISIDDYQTAKLLVDFGIPVRLLANSIIRLFCERNYYKKSFPVIKKLFTRFESVHLISQYLIDTMVKNKDKNLQYLANLAAKQQFIDKFLLTIENADDFQSWMKPIIKYMISTSDYREIAVNKVVSWIQIPKSKLLTSQRFIQWIIDFLKENDVRSSKLISHALTIGDRSIPELIAMSEESFSSGFLSIIKSGNLSQLKEKLKGKKDTYHDLGMGLCWAAKWGHLNLVKYFVEDLSTNIHTKDNKALKWSIKSNTNQITKYLIKKGADLSNIVNSLDILLESKDNEFILDILEKGKNVINNLDQLPYKSITAGNVKILEYCERNGSPIPNVDIWEGNRLIQKGHGKMLQLLKDRGKIPSLSYDKTDLFRSISKGNLELTKFLIENDGNLKYAKKNAVNLAVSSGNSDIVEYLISIGADPRQVEFVPEIYSVFIQCIERGRFLTKMKDKIIQWLNTASIKQKGKYLPEMRQYIEKKILSITSQKKKDTLQELIEAFNQELKIEILDTDGLYL